MAAGSLAFDQKARIRPVPAPSAERTIPSPGMALLPTLPFHARRLTGTLALTFGGPPPRTASSPPFGVVVVVAHDGV